MSAALDIPIERDVPPSRLLRIGRSVASQEVYALLAKLQPGESFAIPVVSPCDPKRLRGFMQAHRAKHAGHQFETGRCPNDPTKYRIWRTA